MLRPTFAALLVVFVGVGERVGTVDTSWPAEASVDAEAAALLVEGAVSTELSRAAALSLAGTRGEVRAQTLRLEVHRAESVFVVTARGGVSYEKPLYVEVHDYRNAIVTFEVHDEGSSYASGEDTRAAFAPVALERGALFASASDWTHATADGRDTRVGPLMGFIQDPRDEFDATVGISNTQGDLARTRRVTLDFPAVAVDALALEGALELSLTRATITVHHAEGVDRFEARTTTTGAAAFEERSVRAIRLSSMDAAATLALTDVATIIVGEDAVARVDGTATFVDLDGVLKAAARRERFATGSLTMRGAFEVDLSPSDRGAVPGAGRPRMRVAAAGEAEDVRWNGAPVFVEIPPAKTQVSLLETLAAAVVVSWTLFTRALLPLRVRDPLAHPSRRAILDALRRRGVLDRRGLEGEAALARGTLLHHLRILQRSGLVGSFPWGDRMVYHLVPGKVSSADARRLAALTSPLTARLARALVESGHLTQADLARMVGVHESTVSRHMRTLRETGLVVPAQGKTDLYRPSALLVEWAKGVA